MLVYVKETILMAADIDVGPKTQDQIIDIVERGGVELLEKEIPQFAVVDYDIEYDEVAQNLPDEYYHSLNKD